MHLVKGSLVIISVSKTIFEYMNKTDVSHGQDVVVGEEALPPDTAVHHVGEVTDWGGNNVNWYFSLST